MPGFKGLQEELEGVANDAFYMNPSMIKFLLVENLALKTLLHEKGIFAPEEFKEHQRKAAEVLEAKTKVELKQHLKRMAEELRQRGNPAGEGPSGAGTASPQGASDSSEAIPSLDGKMGGGSS